MSNASPLALTETEVAEILRASENIAILVGGQALSFWANFYQVSIPATLAAEVTRDADFIGTTDAALAMKAGLSNKHWQFAQVAPGAPSPVTGQLTLATEHGVKEIDFLASIVGLRTEDVRRRAVPVRLPMGVVITVLHPLDVLASRLHNIAEIAAKRNAKGVSQAQWAIRIAGAFLQQTLAERPERELFTQIERIRVILTQNQIASICSAYGLDVLACVPLDQIQNETFKNRRWPQIRHDVEAKIAR